MARPPVPVFNASSNPRPPVPKFSAPTRVDDDEDEDPSLTIVGYSSSLFRDDETAAWLEGEKHLQLWQENKEEDLWIDRYDVRQLLTDASVFRKSQSSAVLVDDPEESQLDAERYGDLPVTGEESSVPDRNAGDGEDERVAASAPTNQFGAVHYSFGGQALAKNQPQRSTPPEIVAFANGWLTELPPGSALPQTFKQHQVIEKTAKFIHKEGKKMEAMLKIKHGGNATFHFLLVDHPLQPYYQALVKYLGYCPEAAELPTLLPSLEQPAEPPTGQTATDAAHKEQEEQTARIDGEEASATVVAEADGQEGDGASARAEAVAVAVNTEQACSAAVSEGNQSGDADVGVSASVSQGPQDAAEHTHGATAQIAQPPEEMRHTIEKLVRWILKSGRDFEKKVKERQRGDPRFDFLMPWNPFNAYYLQRLEAAFSGALDVPVSNASANTGVDANIASSDDVSGSGAPNGVPPWRTSGEPEHNVVATSAAPVDNVAAGSVSADTVASKPPEAAAEAASVDNPKVQFITSFGADSDKSEEEEEKQVADCEGATSVDGEQDVIGKEADAEPTKKERSSRFGPDLSEADKKAARLARAKKLADLVKDKVDPSVTAAKTIESTASEQDKDKDEKDQDKNEKETKSRGDKGGKERKRSRDRDRSRSRSRSTSRSCSRRRSKDRSRNDSRSRKRDSKRDRRSRSRSRSRDRKRSRRSSSRSRHRRSKSDRRSRSPKSQRRRDRHRSRSRERHSRKSSSHRRRSSSTSCSRSRSRQRDRSRTREGAAAAAAAAAALKKVTSTSSPPRPTDRECTAHAQDGSEEEKPEVSNELREKVRAMLAAQLGS